MNRRGRERIEAGGVKKGDEWEREGKGGGEKKIVS